LLKKTWRVFLVLADPSLVLHSKQVCIKF
jgi:hypothetical protein